MSSVKYDGSGNENVLSSGNSSLVNYLAQVINGKNYPIQFYYIIIYLKLTKVSYECLLSQSWVMGSRTSFSVSQQLRPELSAKWMQRTAEFCQNVGQHIRNLSNTSSPPTCHNYQLPTIVIKRPFLSNGLYLANKYLRSLKAKSGTGFSYRVDKEASQYSKKIKVSHSLLS